MAVTIIVFAGIIALWVIANEREFRERYKQVARKNAHLTLKCLLMAELRTVTESNELTDAERRGAQEALLRMVSRLDF